MTRRKRLLILTYCLMAILLAGCWDAADIEDKAFVAGSAIDMADEQTDGSYNLSLTNQMIVPAGIGAPQQGGGGEKAFRNVTESGQSMLMITRKMEMKTSRTPSYEHTSILIISEDVAREPNLIASILDLYIRDHEMRRGIMVFISGGDAKSILEIEPAPEKYPVKYISVADMGSLKTAAVIEPTRLGDVHGYLLSNSSYVLPRILRTGKKAEYNGVAVFHGYDNRMVGILTGEETVGMNLAKKANKGGVVKFEMENKLMVFEITTSKNEMKIDTKDPNNLEVSIDITVEGNIAEMFGSKSLLDPTYLHEIEGKVVTKIEELVNGTIEKAQKELNTDVFGIGDRLKQRHYDTWKKIQKDWEQGENYFAKSNINVSANVIIRGTGSIDRAKHKGVKE